jgi:uncharacterized protein
MNENKKKMSFLFTFICAYLVFLAASYFAQRSYIYIPDRTVPDRVIAGVPDMNVIEVKTQEGLILKGWYKPAAAGRPVILMFHGNGGNIGWRGFKARVFMDFGYGVLMAGYRGYGGNTGKPTEHGLYDDARAYIGWLIAQGIKAENIILYGESLGTGIAVRMAVEYPDVRALVLETPYTSLAAIAQKHMFYFPTYFLVRDRYDSLKIIKQVRAPLLVIHGTADAIVPYRFGQKLFGAANEPKRMETFPLGGHNNLYSFGAAGKIIGFLEKLPAR